MTRNFCFRTTIDDLAVAAAAEAALDAASREYAEGKPGAVMCQLSRSDDGTLVLSGTFVENDYGVRINEILSERKRAIEAESNDDTI